MPANLASYGSCTLVEDIVLGLDALPGFGKLQSPCTRGGEAFRCLLEGQTARFDFDCREADVRVEYFVDCALEGVQACTDDVCEPVGTEMTCDNVLYNLNDCLESTNNLKVLLQDCQVNLDTNGTIMKWMNNRIDELDLAIADNAMSVVYNSWGVNQMADNSDYGFAIDSNLDNAGGANEQYTYLDTDLNGDAVIAMNLIAEENCMTDHFLINGNNFLFDATKLGISRECCCDENEASWLFSMRHCFDPATFSRLGIGGVSMMVDPTQFAFATSYDEKYPAVGVYSPVDGNFYYRVPSRRFGAFGLQYQVHERIYCEGGCWYRVFKIKSPKFGTLVAPGGCDDRGPVLLFQSGTRV